MRKPDRRTAMKSGALYYWGKPCINGHPEGKRYTKGGRCIECAAEAQREDMRIIDEARAELAARHAAA